MQLAGLWEEKLKEEQTKTGPLEEVCAALREALDAEHKKRMEAFENKMKPIIIKDGPSKKVICKDLNCIHCFPMLNISIGKLQDQCGQALL